VSTHLVIHTVALLACTHATVLAAIRYSVRHSLFIGTACIVCGAGSIQLSGIHLSVCPVQPPCTTAAGLVLWAQLAGNIDQLLQQWQANAGTATLSAYAVAECKKISDFVVEYLRQFVITTYFKSCSSSRNVDVNIIAGVEPFYSHL